MKRIRILNPKIEEIFKKKVNHNLFVNVKNMKPLVKNGCPESFIFFKTKFQCRTQPNMSK